MSAAGVRNRKDRGRASRPRGAARRASDVDPGRIRRALTLDVRPVGGRAYIVTGGAEAHEVVGSLCDCPDAFFHRAGPCKHLLAVHLHRRLDPRVLEALRAAVTSEGAS